MSYSWTATGVGFTIAGEPEDRHDGLCKIWLHPGPVLDPEEDCSCRDDDGHTRDSQADVLDRFDSYAPHDQQGRAAS